MSGRVRILAIAALGCVLSLAFLDAATARACPPPVATAIHLGSLPSELRAAATGINGRGQIVGWSEQHTSRVVRPFLWMPATPNASSGVMTQIAALPSGNPSAINDYGQVASTTKETPSGVEHAVLWTPDSPNTTTGGTTIDLGTLAAGGGGWSVALAMNDFGQVVGYSLVFPGARGHAFLWTPDRRNGTTGTMVDLGVLGGNYSMANAINDDGVVVGWSQLGNGTVHAFRWTPMTPNGTTGAMSDLGALPGDPSSAPPWSYATGINRRGDIVGYDRDTNTGFFRPFFWTAGTMLPFDPPDQPGELQIPKPNAINEQRWVAGWNLDGFGNIARALLWIPTVPNGTSGEFITLVSSVNSQAIALNDHAQVVGADLVYNNARAMLWTVVTCARLFLHTGGANLFLDRNEPTDATADFRDSGALKFAAGKRRRAPRRHRNAWKTIGTWGRAATEWPPEWPRTLTAGALRVWLGLKNSDDQGTRFDLRAEVLKNGVPIASGTSNCITGVTRNPANATDVSVPFAVEDADIGPAGALSLRVSARIGTNPSGAFCGGHSNATGLRLYFDAASRPAGITLE